MVEHAKFDAKLDDKAELIAQLDQARAQLARSVDGLRRDADLGTHLKQSFTSHRAAWIGSAGVAGWLLSRLPARKKKIYIQKDGKETAAAAEKAAGEIAGAGVAIAILKTLFTLFRPAITSYASKKIAELAKKNNRWQI